MPKNKYNTGIYTTLHDEPYLDHQHRTAKHGILEFINI